MPMPVAVPFWSVFPRMQAQTLYHGSLPPLNPSQYASLPVPSTSAKGGAGNPIHLTQRTRESTRKIKTKVVT
ncbi:hypothetical protein EV361DRAFT_956056 [Lentinula raphanica]|nr:hypothetical protein EV361DRAFT_956056 [Lentinula raphanica]